MKALLTFSQLFVSFSCYRVALIHFILYRFCTFDSSSIFRCHACARSHSNE